MVISQGFGRRNTTTPTGSNLEPETDNVTTSQPVSRRSAAPSIKAFGSPYCVQYSQEGVFLVDAVAKKIAATKKTAAAADASTDQTTRSVCDNLKGDGAVDVSVVFIS
jgi:hypothetical protein